MDLICGMPGARVASTSSGIQVRGKLNLQRMQVAMGGSGMRACASSKLSDVHFDRELRRRLAGITARANHFQPGGMRTRFGAWG